MSITGPGPIAAYAAGISARGSAVPRVPRGLHSPAGAWAPGRLRWGPVTRPISRPPIQAYRGIQGIPLQPSTAQAIIGGATIPSGGAGNFASSVTNTTPGNLTSCEIWADPNCAAGQSSVTVAWQAVQAASFAGFCIFVMEWSGINLATPLDQTSQNSSSGSGTTFTSNATGVLAQADEVVIGACLGRVAGLALTGPAAPWSNFSPIFSSSAMGLIAGTQIVSATTAQTYAGTITNAANYNACIATYKATGTPVLVQSPPGVTFQFSGSNVGTTAAITVNLANPTTAGNCLIVVAGANNSTSGIPSISGITTAAGAGSSSAGLATVQLGPAGVGNLWYPTQVTLSTTTGITTGLDTSVANLYLGPSGLATTLLGTVFGGNGIVAAALPNIQPGLYLIAKWSGGNNGDQATMNIQGVMNALA